MRRDVVKLPVTAIVSALLILTLSWSAQPLAAEGAAKANPTASPAHLNLLRLARQGKLGQSAPQIRYAAPSSGLAAAKKAADQRVKAKLQAGTEGKEKAEPKQVFVAPDAATRQALATSLARHLMTSGVSPDSRDLPLLQTLNRLSAPSSGTSLAAVRLQNEDPGDFTPVHEAEPNDEWTSAQAIGYGNALEGDGVPETDVDVFSFEAQAGDYIRLEANPTGENGWVTMMLFDPDSNQVTNGLYYLERNSVSSDSRFMPPYWGGGNLIGKSLDLSGTYHVVILTHPGHIFYYRLDDVKQESALVDATQPVGYRVTLKTLSVRPVSGQLTDDTGQAVAGANLAFWSNDYYNGSRVESGADGSFALNLPEGDYSVSVESPAGSRYPADQISQSLTVGPSGAKVDVSLKSGVIFSGRMVEDRGGPVPWGSFSLSDDSGGQYRWASADSNGEFSVAVFPGMFNLYVYTSWEYPDQPVTQGLSVQSDLRYDIIIDTGNRISGRVLDPNGAGMAYAQLNFQGYNVSRCVVTDETGAYSTALVDGDYTVVITPSIDSPVPPQGLPDFTVNADQVKDFTLQAGAVLSGIVRDNRGNPVPNAQVNVWYDSWSNSSGEVFKYEDGDTAILRERTDPEKREMPAVTSRNVYTGEDGRWQIAVTAGTWVIEFVAPWNFPSQYLKGGSYTVAAGDQVEVPAVVMDYGVTFKGRVVLDNGTPLSYDGFYMYSGGETIYDEYGNPIKPDEPQPYYSYWVYTEEDGSFNVQVMPAAYSIQFQGRADREGYPSQTVGSVDLSTDREMTFTLQSGYLVSGRITSPGGKGLESCYISFYSKGIRAEGASTWTDIDGNYAVRLMPGPYGINVEPVAGYFPDSSVYSLMVDTDCSFDLTLSRGIWVGGRALDRDGKPVPKVTIHAIPVGSDDADTLYHILPMPYETRLAGEEDTADIISADTTQGDDPLIMPIYRVDPYYANTDENGYWEMTVKPGVYDLYAWPSYEYASLFLAGVDMTSDTKLELVFDLAEIKVSGSVEYPDGHPADSVLVSAYDPTTGLNASTWTNTDGRYEFMLPSGRYEVVIDKVEDGNELQVIPDMDITADRALNFRLGEGLLDDSETTGPALPKAFEMSQNYPNPFNPSTTIQYDLPQAGHVQIKVFDIRGRVVATLVNREETAGSHTVQWNGREDSGRALSSGVYFYRMETASFNRTRKMVLLK
ncbi:carboxypeptidase regulatory-like domain-containing protein [bacterium]|nr:carboxypeptidase regulatory-like domain-containing protein [bacterium]